MPAEKKTEEKIRTEVILPRNYGLAFWSRGRQHFIFPSYYALGQAIRLTERELNEHLEEWRGSKRTLPYGKKDLSALVFDELKGLLLQKIEQKERARNIYLVGGKEAVSEVTEFRGVLSGKVKRKTHGGAKGRDVAVTLGNPWLSLERRLDYGDATSESTADHWNQVKRAVVHDAYLCVLEIENYLDCRGKGQGVARKGSTTRRIPSMPFRLAEDNPAMRTLVMEVLLRHYILEQGHYVLNKALLDNPNIYNEPPLKMVREGLARFKVIRQMNQRREIPDYQVQRCRRVLGEERRYLERRGFYREGLGIEFKDTPFEIVGEKYVRKGDLATLLVDSDSHLPYFVKRRLRGAADIFQPAPAREKHPFTSARGPNEVTLDDFTRRTGMTKIEAPGLSEKSLYVPQWMREKARELYENMEQPKTSTP